MANRTKADARYRLAPTEPMEIIRCTAIGCLAALSIVAIPRIVAYIATALGVIG